MAGSYIHELWLAQSWDGVFISPCLALYPASLHVYIMQCQFLNADGIKDDEREPAREQVIVVCC
jgi:hypothetical protein